MPYDNVPESQWGDMDKCVDSVMGEGKDKETAVAICYASIVEGKAEALKLTRAAGFVLNLDSAVKAAGDWELDVLAIPFTRDSDGQWFDANTNTMPDAFSAPVVVYQHGVDAGAKGWQSNPVVIGKAGDLQKKSDGWHVRVLLDKASEYARRIMDAAKRGAVAVSSGTIDHLARLEIGGKLIPYDKRRPGRIAVWPFAEISLWDKGGGNLQPANHTAYALPAVKAVYDAAGLTLPDLCEPEPGLTPGASATKSQENLEDAKMEKELQEQIASAVNAALENERANREAAAKAEADKQAAIKAAVEEERVKWEAEAAKSRRLPFGRGEAPKMTQFADTAKYDHLSAADLGLAIEVQRELAVKSSKMPAPSPSAYKALMLKVARIGKEDESADTINYATAGLKAAIGPDLSDDAIKAATDPMYTGGSLIGSDWVGTAYANQIWEAIRATDTVVAKIPTETIPDGYSSKYWPLESSDPTWYKVAEASSSDATLKVPAATVTASQMATANKQITVAKMGARVLYTGELVEDSLIAFVPQLRKQLVTSGAEQLAHAVIDGDVETSANKNINDIAGTPASTDLFLMFDGLRKLPLITNTANSVSAAGGLTEDHFIDTMWLMGTAGLAAADMSKCSFVIDPNTYKKAMKLAALKTKDVWANATLEGGRLASLWGYEVIPSWFINFKSATRKSNTAGKVDQDTVGNNAYGSILAVRWDQWKLSYKRQMTIETTRIANADSWEIVALARLGLGYRDTEASAITYYVGV